MRIMLNRGKGFGGWAAIPAVVGLSWVSSLAASRSLEDSLPVLLSNLSHLKSAQLAGLETELENSPHVSAAILVLREDASRRSGFSPAAERAGESAFRAGLLALCPDFLAPSGGGLVSASARRFLLAGFYGGIRLGAESIRLAASRSNAVEVQSLAALNLSQWGNFKEADAFLSGRTPAPIRDYIHAQELDAADKTDASLDYFRNAFDSPDLEWPGFHVVVVAELFKHYSLTGNRYKADQLWDDIKADEGIDTLPALKEFLAAQLGLRGYEKQARALYRSLYPSHPARPAELKALWDEFMAEDSTGLEAQIRSLLAVDSLDCDANQFAMRYAKSRHQSREIIHRGRNVVLYCPDVVEPYLDLANALLETAHPAEARVYFGKYVERGGDRNNVPTYMR